MFKIYASSIIRGDKESNDEIMRLDALVDPFCRLKGLSEKIEIYFKTEYDALKEKHAYDPLSKKIYRASKYFF